MPTFQNQLGGDVSASTRYVVTCSGVGYYLGQLQTSPFLPEGGEYELLWLIVDKCVACSEFDSSQYIDELITGGYINSRITPSGIEAQILRPILTPMVEKIQHAVRQVYHTYQPTNESMVIKDVIPHANSLEFVVH